MNAYNSVNQRPTTPTGETPEISPCGCGSHSNYYTYCAMSQGCAYCTAPLSESV